MIKRFLTTLLLCAFLGGCGAQSSNSMEMTPFEASAMITIGVLLLALVASADEPCGSTPC